MRKRVLALQVFVVLFLLNDAMAAPALPPKTECERCRKRIDVFDSESRQAITLCFAARGVRSPAQHYCLLKYFFPDQRFNVVPMCIPSADLQKWMEACTAEYGDNSTPNGALDLSEQQQSKCLDEYKARLKKITIVRFNCMLTCDPTPPVFGQEAGVENERN